MTLSTFHIAHSTFPPFLFSFSPFLHYSFTLQIRNTVAFPMYIRLKLCGVSYLEKKRVSEWACNDFPHFYKIHIVKKKKTREEKRNHHY